MKKMGIVSVCILTVAILVTGCAKSNTSEDGQAELDPENPVTISVWHCYNGAQQDAFNELIKEFNSEEGKQLGIHVEPSGQGEVNSLEEKVMDAVTGVVGADEVPNVFATYADTAYTLEEQKKLVDLRHYLTEEEISQYVDSYIEDGKFSSKGGLKIFPVAKATEVFMVNQTELDQFVEATGADVKELSTIEGVTDIAQKYYEWTDSLTEQPEDGKAFFGRDGMANYFIIGAKQLGTTIFKVSDGKVVLNFDEPVMKKLWDNYYVPYIKGYFSSYGRFRSDDIKTGKLVAFVGSSAGATFFPKEVTLNDSKTYPIEMGCYECPQFADGEKYAVQQGPGMAVVKTTEKEIKASVEFLKWFTSKERNVEFSVTSGYLPVRKDANNMKQIEQYTTDNQQVNSIIETSIKIVKDTPLYSVRGFQEGTEARMVLEHSLSDKAKADRNTVVQNISGGMSRIEAISQFDNDANFKSWYEATKTQLEDLTKE